MIRREDFTKGEWLYLARRRADVSVAVRAGQYGVSEDRYRAWERDRVPQDAIPRLKHTPRDVTYGEYSAIMRRRKGWPLEEVARRRGTSKVTIIKQEHDRTRTAIELANWWHIREKTLYFPSPR